MIAGCISSRGLIPPHAPGTAFIENNCSIKSCHWGLVISKKNEGLQNCHICNILGGRTKGKLLFIFFNEIVSVYVDDVKPAYLAAGGQMGPKGGCTGDFFLFLVRHYILPYVKMLYPQGDHIWEVWSQFIVCFILNEMKFPSGWRSKHPPQTTSTDWNEKDVSKEDQSWVSIKSFSRHVANWKVNLFSSFIWSISTFWFRKCMGHYPVKSFKRELF